MSNPTPIENILQRLENDDRDILRELFQQHYTPICKAVFRFVKDKSIAEDIGQEVFIKLWEKRKTLQINSSISAYLRKMAINQAITYLRSNKKHETEDITEVQISAKAPDSESQYLQKELHEQIDQAINTLPPRCRLVFQLSRYEELSYKEIATKLEISVKTVENQMSKALKVLREALKNHLGLLFFIIATMWIYVLNISTLYSL